MQFTEHEMTVGVDAVARELFLARKLPWRRTKGEAAWHDLPPFTKYQHRSAAGEMILPTLTALPERPSPGARPDFSLDELTTAAEEGARALADHRAAGSWEATSAKRRSRLIRVTAMLTQHALDAMPPRPADDGA
ncbi:hypothetical protein [Nocardioides daejeonensis]|uniref:hypothetical protein n=1 Tax=Nocardioides daejeonensis TaxID=1046556 RepID=UPI000D7415D6|nr:hypothetical protein [Nocardioides daejeonensis]